MKKSKTPLWIGLGLVVAVVVVALVLVLSGVFSNKTAAGGGGSELPADPKEAAKAVVTNYLTAVSEGRAEDAKKFLGSSSATSDASLLTDEVLKDSLTRAPITEIRSVKSRLSTVVPKRFLSPTRWPVSRLPKSTRLAPATTRSSRLFPPWGCTCSRGSISP